MSIQTDLFSLIGPLFGGRVYPSVAPSGVGSPYATYFRVSATEQATLDVNGGTGNASNTRLQIDVWALSYADVQAGAAAVKAALKGWLIENVVLGEQDLFESETRLHRVMLDVSLWHL